MLARGIHARAERHVPPDAYHDPDPDPHANTNAAAHRDPAPHRDP